MTDESKCTCNDEFITTPCPIHSEEKLGYGNKDIIISDEHLKINRLDTFVGYKFFCPVCGMDSIMEFFNYCPNCGSHVIVRSKIVTEAIRKSQKGVE